VTGFSGFEPQVGEIRALRTFRVGAGGLLLPLFGERAWVDGANAAECRVADGKPDHEIPGPDCTCGFYAYGDQRAAAEYPFAHYVLAVVACWGRVIAGTKGIRAQHARIEAMWFSSVVPAALVAAVAERHPSVAVYQTPEHMLAEHPLTRLDAYADDPRPSVLRRRATKAGVAAAIVAGLVPTGWISALPDGRLAWMIAFGVLMLVAFTVHRRQRDAAAQRRRLIARALALWMVAPWVGPLGLLLFRLPLMQLAVLTATHRMAMRRLARTFPAPTV
jgi:hypothetical protein